MDFQEFVGGLSAFSSRGGRDEKLKCTSLSPEDTVEAHELTDGRAQSRSKSTIWTETGTSPMGSCSWC